MNNNYFGLPLDKQNKLLNSGYKVFALYPYKKASMSAIADEAAISKSLLFYYFKNKKEYHLFLFDNSIDFMNEQKSKSDDNEKVDLFATVSKTVERRMNALQNYPYLFRFAAKAYYETHDDLTSEISKRKLGMTQFGKNELLSIINSEPFKNESDIPILIDIILYIAEGCMRGLEDLDVNRLNEIRPEFQQMMDSLKKRYYKNVDQQEE